MHARNLMKHALLSAAFVIGATTAQAACTDTGGGPRFEAFETLKSAILATDFETAAAQIDLGGNRENNIIAGLSRLSRQNVQPFTECVLIERRARSPQYMSEIVYFTDGAAQEYWLFVSGITAAGNVRLMNVEFTNDFSRFRGWLR